MKQASTKQTLTFSSFFFASGLALAAVSNGGCAVVEPGVPEAMALKPAAAAAAQPVIPEEGGSESWSEPEPESPEVDADRIADALKSSDSELLSSAGGVDYPDTEVQEAVLTCMTRCGEEEGSADERRTCELRCANSSWTSAWPDDCTVDCMTQMYSCRASCAREVDRPTDVGTCGLNCANRAQSCLRDTCGESH